MVLVDDGAATRSSSELGGSDALGSSEVDFFSELGRHQAEIWECLPLRLLLRLFKVKQF